MDSIINGKYFSPEFRDFSSITFTEIHLRILAIIAIINLLIFVFREKLRNEKVDKCIRYTFASVLILSITSLQWWYFATDTFTFNQTLPLHICRVAQIFAIIILFRKDRKLYNVTYFWTMSGVLPAILTPDINGFMYPSYRFIEFFVFHGLVFTSILYMTFVHSFRVTVDSAFRVFKFTNIYAAFVMLVNWVTGGNYLYLSRKPNMATPLDYLGPWPWYIIQLQLLAAIGFFINLIPIFIEEYLERKAGAAEKAAACLYSSQPRTEDI